MTKRQFALYIAVSMKVLQSCRFGQLRKLLLIIVLAIYIRASIGLFPYSGEHRPPRFGDYEAHRYWSAVTLHMRPVANWYTHPGDYWVIDYPPLSAYLAFAIGICARLLDFEGAVQADAYGYESESSRAFFRGTVLLVDLLFFFPAAYFASGGDLNRFASLTLFQPCWILIDHAHFHYTCIQLGFILWMIARYRTIKLTMIATAVLFKQTSIYFLPVPAMDALRQAWRRAFPDNDVLFSVLVALFILYPFKLDALLRRVFPFHRGVFEDKVATFWCTISPLLRRTGLLRSRFLPPACGLMTLVAVIPFLMGSPGRCITESDRLRLCIRLTGCSLAFYLFSYHVHEKHILLPLLPLSLCAHEYPDIIIWATSTAVFSLLPLFLHEGSAMALVALIIWTCLGRGRRPSVAWMLLALPLGILLAVDGNPFRERYPYLLPYFVAIFCFLNFLMLLLWCYIEHAKLSGCSFTVEGARNLLFRSLNFSRAPPQKLS